MDQSFSSISEAARYVGVSVSTIQSRLASKKHPDWTYAKTYKKVATRVARPVVIDQTDYISVSSAGAAMGVCEKKVRKNIRTKSNWCYFDSLDLSQRKMIPNLDKQIIFANKFGYSSSRPVKVNQEVFSSIRQAALAF
jgi:hypothetical protein